MDASMTRKPNSVMTVIYLAYTLPYRSSDCKGRRTTLTLCLAPNGVYTAQNVTVLTVSFYLAFSSLP